MTTTEPTAQNVRELRREILSVPLDGLRREDVYTYRRWYVNLLALYESTLSEREQMKPIDDAAAQITAAPISQTLTVVLRAAVAVALPALLFAAIAGFAAGVAVAMFRFTANLFQ